MAMKVVVFVVDNIQILLLQGKQMNHLYTHTTFAMQYKRNRRGYFVARKLV